MLRWSHEPPDASSDTGSIEDRFATRGPMLEVLIRLSMCVESSGPNSDLVLIDRKSLRSLVAAEIQTVAGWSESETASDPRETRLAGHLS